MRAEKIETAEKIQRRFPGVLMLFVEDGEVTAYGNDAIALINATQGELQYAKGNKEYVQFPASELDWRVPSLSAREYTLGIVSVVEKDQGVPEPPKFSLN